MNPRVLAAVENNARWCDIVCRSHGLPTAMSEPLWVAPEGSPPLYPDAVTLVPGVPADVVLNEIENRPGCSVKDSFADVDLGGLGFIELFEAHWLFRQPAGEQARTRLRWDTVTTEVELEQWVSSADLEGIVRPELLGDVTVRVLAARDDRGITAGAIAYRTGRTVGLSNVFTSGISADAAWADLPAAVENLFGALPIVGYEHGDELTIALARGFQVTAPLRVWLKPPA